MNDRARRPPTAAERLDWLRLIRSENVGPITFRRLIERYGTARAALDALPELARRGGKRAVRLCPAGEAERELDAAARVGAGLVALGEVAYPPLLAHVEDAPPLLFVRGEVRLLGRPMIAIVGARNASLNGRRFAERLATDLGQAGQVVVSGLARGIDAAAHQGALAGGTVAVLAGGVDVVYPPENEGLYARIVAEGAVVSELPPGTEPQARHFPVRNRLISGMARGVVVVEAALRSGSLITARAALDQGREVFAVPGSPLDPRARGANDLIRQGAVLTEGAGDVLRVLADPSQRRLSEGDDGLPAAADTPAPDEPNLARAREDIVAGLGPSPVTVDEIVRRCQFSPAAVAAVLLELELAGRLERHPGNQVSLLQGV
jgi:DNA processing protein